MKWPYAALCRLDGHFPAAYAGEHKGGAMQTLMTVDDAARQLGMGRTTVHDLMKKGTLRSVKIGRARRIPSTEVEALISRLTAEQWAGGDETVM